MLARRQEHAGYLLTPEQYRATQQDGTVRPFQNEYQDNKEPGLYVDVVPGEQLVSPVVAFAIWLISRVILALYIAIGPLLIRLAQFPRDTLLPNLRS